MSQQLILLVVVMAALFYLLIYRPQSRAKQARETLNRSLDVGRRVVTAGGIHGEVRALDEETVDLEVADGIVMTFDRRSVTALTDEAEIAAALEDEDEDDEDADEDDGADAEETASEPAADAEADAAEGDDAAGGRSA